MSLVDAYIQWLPTIIWWLIVIEFLGLLAFPIVSRVAINLKDKGFFLSKVISIVFVSYISWITSFIVGHSQLVIFFSIFLVALLSFFILKKYGFPKINKNFILKTEIVFFVVFFIFLSLHMYHPYIEGTNVDTLYFGERFMDHGFAKAVSRSSSFPPNDPWLSGVKFEHYYYFGFVISSILSTISNIPMNIMFNLWNTTITALVSSMVFGFGYLLTNKKRFAVFGILFFVFFGNLFSAKLVFDNYENLIESVKSYSHIYYWDSTRQLTGQAVTINEFPFFTSMWGDVHAHFVSFLFQILVVILLYNFILSKKKNFKIFGKNKFHIILSLIVFSMVLGILLPTNTWDYPTYAILSMIVLSCYNISGNLNIRKSKNILNMINKIKIKKNILLTLTPVLISFILYLPYTLLLKTGRASQGLALTSYPSPLIDIIYIFGFLFFILYSFIFLSEKILFYIKKYYRFSILFALITLFLIQKFEVLLVVAPLIFISGIILLEKILQKQKTKPEYLFSISIIFTLSMLIAFTSIFYFHSSFSNGIVERMNTVFKLHLQVWIMIGLISGYCLKIVLEKLSVKFKNFWNIIFLILVLVSSIYPVLATYTYFKGFEAKPTLDGFEYMKTRDINVVLQNDKHVRVKIEPDYYAVLWIDENIKGEPVILEAVPKDAPWNQPFDYTYFTRIASLTGLPTLVGWPFHEFNWGYETDFTEPRILDVNEIYETTDNKRALQLLKKYNVIYVYVGVLEKLQYSKVGLKKFDEIGKKVYDEKNSTIYKII